MPLPDIDAVVGRLAMQPHPEGGYYSRTWESAGHIPHAELPERFSGDRLWSTAILYLLPAGGISRLHRIAGDELWHFHLGSPLTIVELMHGGARATRLGADLLAGETVQHAVPGGRWFGAANDGPDWALAGCTVSPGFDFADFAIGDRLTLLEAFPACRKWIERLT